jgi:hypothetical protein
MRSSLCWLHSSGEKGCREALLIETIEAFGLAVYREQKILHHEFSEQYNFAINYF